MLVSIPVSVTVTLADKSAKARGAKSLTLTARATDVSAANVLATVFPSTPDFVIALLRPATFGELTFMWDGTFNVTGSPDLSKVPGLNSILSYLGFSQQDIKVRPQLGAIEIAIEKVWTLRLGAPFTGPAQLAFGLGLSVVRPWRLRYAWAESANPEPKAGDKAIRLLATLSRLTGNLLLRVPLRSMCRTGRSPRSLALRTSSPPCDCRS